jgi:hypothetical protein
VPSLPVTNVRAHAHPCPSQSDGLTPRQHTVDIPRTFSVKSPRTSGQYIVPSRKAATLAGDVQGARDRRDRLDSMVAIKSVAALAHAMGTNIQKAHSIDSSSRASPSAKPTVSRWQSAKTGLWIGEARTACSQLSSSFSTTGMYPSSDTLEVCLCVASAPEQCADQASSACMCAEVGELGCCNDRRQHHTCSHTFAASAEQPSGNGTCARADSHSRSQAHADKSAAVAMTVLDQQDRCLPARPQAPGRSGQQSAHCWPQNRMSGEAGQCFVGVLHCDHELGTCECSTGLHADNASALRVVNDDFTGNHTSHGVVVCESQASEPAHARLAGRSDQSLCTTTTTKNQQALPFVKCMGNCGSTTRDEQPGDFPQRLNGWAGFFFMLRSWFGFQWYFGS